MSTKIRQMNVSTFRDKVFAIATAPSKFLPLVVTKAGKPVFSLAKIEAPKKVAPKK